MERNARLGSMRPDRRTTAILALIFGVLILLQPNILALLVALYLIIYGIVELVSKP